ncbi:lamin tail domain-containing protein [Candidatus Uhrbacteria bacterium]|nr:lamin tail domain-containing protein [Candidatus Uhrbacteria bacterium]
MHYFMLRVLSLLILLFSGFFAQPVHAESTLVIGEINWAGSSLFTADEWLELWNLGDTPIELNGFQLIGASTAPAIVFGSHDIISSHSAFLIANNHALDPKSVLAIAPNLATSTLSLSNEKLAIQLLNAEGTLIDQAGDGHTPLAGSTGENKTSMIRVAPEIAGDQKEAWASATSTPGLIDLSFDLSSTPSSYVSASSSESLPETSITNSTSSDTMATTTNLATSEITIILSATSTTSTIEITSIKTQTTTTEPLFNIHLNEIFPAPSSGPEWIELYASGTIDIVHLDGWTIEDARGPIFRFTSSTPINFSLIPYIFITLTGSHLNNDGDIIRIKNSSGEIVDEVIYNTIKKNETFIRLPDVTGVWQISTMPTPAQTNVLITQITEPALAPVRIVYETAPTPLVTAIPIPAPVPPPQQIKTIQPTQQKKIVETKTTAPTIKQTTLKDEKIVAPISNQPKIKIVSVKKPSTPNPLISTTIPMLTTLDSGTRVRLSGSVGSVPKLLSTNQFVLQTEDGRGLLVYGNGKQPSAALGSLIRLTGTLTVNDQGAALKMLARDRWESIQKMSEVRPRLVDLGAPGQEDAWSLIEATGTVQAVRTSTVTLDLEETTLSVMIRPIVQYRAQRLQAGDVLHVRGLLDTRGQELKMYPRTSDEITLISHKEKIPVGAPTKQNNIPPWAPIGSAGATVAIAQGVKYYRKFAEQKRLAKMLTEASQNLQNI